MQPGTSVMFTHILIPTDLTDRAFGTADAIKQLVGDGPVRVTLLHVVQQIPETSADEFKEFYSLLEQRSAEKLEALAARLDSPGIEVDRHVTYGQPAMDIATFADENHVDLIALASHTADPTKPGKGWGTMSYKIGMLARCPVLLVK